MTKPIHRSYEVMSLPKSAFPTDCENACREIILPGGECNLTKVTPHHQGSLLVDIESQDEEGNNVIVVAMEPRKLPEGRVMYQHHTIPISERAWVRLTRGFPVLIYRLTEGTIEAFDTLRMRCDRHKGQTIYARVEDVERGENVTGMRKEYDLLHLRIMAHVTDEMD